MGFWVSAALVVAIATGIMVLAAILDILEETHGGPD